MSKRYAELEKKMAILSRAIKRARRKISVSIHRGEMEPRSEYCEELDAAMREVGIKVEEFKFGKRPTPDGGGEPDQPRTWWPIEGMPGRVYNESDLPEEAPKCDGDGRIHEFDELIGPSSIECPGCEACMPTIPG